MNYMHSAKWKVGLKRRARGSNDPVHHIFGDEVEGATTQIIIKLPKIASLAS